MRVRTILLALTGTLFLVAGIIVGWSLKKNALSYSEELESAYRAIFWFGISLSFFIVAVISRKINDPKLFYQLSFLIIIFLFFVSFPFLIMPGIPPIRYTYESSDRQFAMYEHVGGKTTGDQSVNFDDIKREFEIFKKNNKASDPYLCRTFSMDKRVKWYHLYIWFEYEFDARWRLPYLEPSVKPNYLNNGRVNAAKGGGHGIPEWAGMMVAGSR